MRAIWHTTASKEPSGNGSAGDVTLAPVDVGTDAAGHGEHGLVEVDADDVARRRSGSAAVRATIPVPHATSSTRWPAATPAASHRTGAHWAKNAGTKSAS